MAINIGLIDWDASVSKTLAMPNYDLCVTYAHLKRDPNISIRLIISLDYENLRRYDKIYLFTAITSHVNPSGVIPHYYDLPIEEYGSGFQDKPLRPNLLETRTIEPDRTCYNPIIQLSTERPKYKWSWKLTKSCLKKKYIPIRLYEKFDGEWLRKDFPTSRYCVIYDDPTELLNDPAKRQVFLGLLDNHHRLMLASLLDIAKLNDTSILERIVTDPYCSRIRRMLCCSSVCEPLRKLASWYVAIQPRYPLNIKFSIPVVEDGDQCFEQLLELIGIYQKTEYKVRFKVGWDRAKLQYHRFALLAYNYLLLAHQHKRFRQSFYEYIMFYSYRWTGAPSIMFLSPDGFEHLVDTYGPIQFLIGVEDYIAAHPETEEIFFLGGRSTYERIRKQHQPGRGNYAFTTSANDISEEFGAQ